jgi:hypothetical protein
MRDDERLMLSPAILKAAQLFKMFPDLELVALELIEEAACDEGI